MNKKMIDKLIVITCITFALVLTAVLGVPHLLHRGANSPINTCRNQLRSIDNAKAQFAHQHEVTDGTALQAHSITQYLRDGAMPVCPKNGVYAIGVAGDSPDCSIHGKYPERQ